MQKDIEKHHDGYRGGYTFDRCLSWPRPKLYQVGQENEALEAPVLTDDAKESLESLEDRRRRIGDQVKDEEQHVEPWHHSVSQTRNTDSCPATDRGSVQGRSGIAGCCKSKARC